MDYQREQQELSIFFNYYYELANNRVPWAQSWIADAFFWGWGVERNYDQYIEWDTKAARNGCLISARRMMLYYQSIGSYAAPAYLCTMNNNERLKFDILNNSFFSTPNDFLNVYANKSVPDMINIYENALDVSNEYRTSSIEYRALNALILKVINCIYGFSGQQNFNEAMNLIKQYDISKIENLGYNNDSDLVHYYCCLRENNTQGTEELDDVMFNKSIYKNDIYHENAEEVYKVRHYIRKAFLGYGDYAWFIGRGLLEENNKPDKEERRVFYHDDYAAMYYLSMVAGKVPNSRASYDAVKLSSNPELKTYNFEYSRNLCVKIDDMLDTVQDNDDVRNVDRLMMRRLLTEAYADIARGIQDTNIQRDLGNRGINQFNKYYQDYCNKYSEFDAQNTLSFLIGKINYECFHDYNKALSYFSKYEGVNDVVAQYIQNCKRNGARI